MSLKDLKSNSKKLGITLEEILYKLNGKVGKSYQEILLLNILRGEAHVKNLKYIKPDVLNYL